MFVITISDIIGLVMAGLVLAFGVFVWTLNKVSPR